jgi:hypothetical protein
MNPVTTNTLLTYSLNTMPEPLQASPTVGNPIYGSLSFVVSNGGRSIVNLSQLQFTLPVGTLAQELTSDAGAILWATSPATLWNVRMNSPGVFLLLPQSGSPIPVSQDGMVIQFYNIQVNQQVGTVSINVDETATKDSNPAQLRTAVFSVAKFPYGFYFANFTAQVPMVSEGGTVTLTWQGSDNATYSMQWSEAPPEDVTHVRSWPSPNLTSDTTFLLRASVVFQGETVTTDLSTTVIVANPELQPSSLQVSGISNLQGATTIGTGSTQATVNGNLTVNGSTLLNGTTTLSGNTTANNLTVNGALTSGSSATFNGATVNQNLTVNGAALLNGTTTLRGDTVAGNVTINGVVTAINGPQNVGQGTYEAQTDGFLVASFNILRVGTPSGCYIMVNMPYGMYWVGGLTSLYPPTGGGLTLPLQKGQSCAISFVNIGGPACVLPFIPLGNIPPGQQALRKVSDDVPKYELPKQSSLGSQRAESMADALIQAVKSGDKGHLIEALKGLFNT